MTLTLTKPFGEIHCPHCHRWFRSPIHFGNPRAFLSSSLIGTVIACSRCGQRTDCDRDKMRWRTSEILSATQMKLPVQLGTNRRALAK